MNERNSKKVIIDVDAGTDDYLALLLLLYAEKKGELNIEAIFCSMGNTSIENVAKNVVRLLEVVGRTDVSIKNVLQKYTKILRINNFVRKWFFKHQSY